MGNRSFSDVGGTPGGLGHFLIGFAMTCVGGYLLSNQVSVVGSYWSFYGGNTFGITLLPMLIGVGVLFWNGRSLAGWLLTIAGARTPAVSWAGHRVTTSIETERHCKTLLVHKHCIQWIR
jgi:hypothetical protein